VHRRIVTAVGIVLAILLVACSTTTSTEPDLDPNDTAPDVERPGSGSNTPPPIEDAAPDEPAVDPATVGANELGEIPVLMYHRILDSGGSEYDLTPEEFRGELQYLYDNGYRPIRTIDLVRGQIDIPAGMSPVVLTFDDSTREQFGYMPDGSVNPDTAFGILLEFADRYDDFEAVASVYVVTSSLFGGGGDGKTMLADLHDRGFEIGNHTHGHDNLARLTDTQIQETLARNREEVRKAVPSAEVATLSLPFGVWPKNRSLAASGSAGGVTYKHEAILLVGAHPASSPFDAGFDPLAVPRIRSAPSWTGGDPDFGSAFWFDVLDRRPERRYVSDGNADTISFPAELADRLAPHFADRANPY